MKNVYVIILTWNRKDLVKKCLESIKEIKSKHKISVVVVDNASNDLTVDFIKKNYSDVILLENTKNLGWSGGNNVGIKFALKKQADYIVLINNDIVLDPKCIDNLIKEMEVNKKIGIASPKIYKYNSKPKVLANAGNYFNKYFLGTDRGSGEKDKGQYEKVVNVDFVAGLTCTKSEVFKKVGFIDNKFFLYFEDADFCMRVRKKGYYCIYAPKAVLYHNVSATIGFNSPTHTYYNVRNHLLFIEKYSNKFKLLIQLFRYAKQLFRSIYHKEKNARYIFFGLRDYLFRRFYQRKYW